MLPYVTEQRRMDKAKDALLEVADDIPLPGASYKEVESFVKDFRPLLKTYMEACERFGPDDDIRQFCQAVLSDLEASLSEGMRFILQRAANREPAGCVKAVSQPIQVKNWLEGSPWPEEIDQYKRYSTDKRRLEQHDTDTDGRGTKRVRTYGYHASSDDLGRQPSSSRSKDRDEPVMTGPTELERETINDVPLVSVSRDQVLPFPAGSGMDWKVKDGTSDLVLVLRKKGIRGQDIPVVWNRHKLYENPCTTCSNSQVKCFQVEHGFSCVLCTHYRRRCDGRQRNGKTPRGFYKRKARKQSDNQAQESVEAVPHTSTPLSKTSPDQLGHDPSPTPEINVISILDAIPGLTTVKSSRSASRQSPSLMESNISECKPKREAKKEQKDELEGLD